MPLPPNQRTIERILADPRYWDAKYPDHEATKAEATHVFRAAYPEPAGTLANIIHVRAYTRRQNGRIIQVSDYDRSATIARSPAAAISPSDDGLAFLKMNEGFKPKIYPDTADKSTLGYGHKIKRGESFPNGVTRKEAERMFEADVAEADVAEAAAAVRRLVKAELTQGQFDALVSLVYNVGSGAFARSKMLRKLSAGDLTGAATEFDDWDKVRNAKGEHTRDNGLTNRRQREKRLFVNGDYR